MWNTCRSAASVMRRSSFRRRHLRLGAQLYQPLFLNLLSRLRLDVVRMTRALGAFRAHGFARLRGQAVDLLWAEHPALFQDLALLRGEGRRLCDLVALEAIGLAASELHDLLGNPHPAPILPAHGTKIRIHVQTFVMEFARCVAVERQFEVLFPI